MFNPEPFVFDQRAKQDLFCNAYGGTTNAEDSVLSLGAYFKTMIANNQQNDRRFVEGNFSFGLRKGFVKSSFCKQ
jgi:hypothetical protein